MELSAIADLVEALSSETETGARTYQAVVSRIDNDGTVWVNLAGSNRETPTSSTSSEIDPNDAVTVEWRNNRLYIVGNTSNPSAGKSRVNSVERTAEQAKAEARSAVLDADTAKQAAEGAQGQVKIITETVDSMFTLEVDSEVSDSTAHLSARLLKGNEDVKTDYDSNYFKWLLRSENGERLLGRGYSLDVDMSIIGYASTILCRFIRPELYELTDHNLTAITDQNLAPVQVSFAGIYNQPIATRNTLKSKSKALLRATTEVGNPTVTREVNLYKKNSMRKITQHFWTEESGEHAGAHITDLEKDEFLADPANGGGNLLAMSTGIAIRDGLEDMAVFGADGMRIGRESEKHVDVTPTSFNVVDEDGSTPFSVSTDGSLRNALRGYNSSVTGADDYNPMWTTQVYLRGNIVDNKVYFGVSTSGVPTDYTAYIENPTKQAKTIIVSGVRCSVRVVSASVLSVSFDNTNSTKRYVGVRMTEEYYETTVKVNDSTLETRFQRLAIVDSVGTSVGEGGAYVYTYGKIAMLVLIVYNTNSISAGNLIYKGTLLNYLPRANTKLIAVHGKDVIAGYILPNGDVSVYNTTSSSLSTTSTNTLLLTATYIYQ